MLLDDVIFLRSKELKIKNWKGRFHVQNLGLVLVQAFFCVHLASVLASALIFSPEK